ncbi:MAG TPA: hypothetical protein VLQ93_11030, partial [Myxococcaceae bacterium]|nr:hypothetical protein [Myxococcaceae bacterium]
EPSATPAPAGPVLASLLRAMFPDGERTSEACFVREVASPWQPPEAGAGAAPPRADTPAPVVPVTTLREGGTRLKVKKQHKAGEKKGIGSDLARWCIGATAAATAACVGAQVRPMPEPEACPAGAVDVMTDRFDIPIRGTSPGLGLPGFNPFQGGKREPIPVQEGPATLYLGAPWAKLPSKSYLSGRLIIGPERVYGRFTEVLLPSGERLPVCFALIDPKGKPGLPIEGTGEQGVVKAFPIVEVEAVRSFK